MQHKHASREELIESSAVSWWSWRPGVRPIRAFLFGGLLSLIALFLLLNGITTLIAGVLDSATAPVRVSGVVAAHGKDVLGSPQITLILAGQGTAGNITLNVSPATATALANGSSVTVDYAPHLHTPYALEGDGHRYLLPGASASGNPFTSWTIVLFGLLLLPYPLLLSFWGWRDLHTRQACQRVGAIVALRIARQTTTRTPGMVPRTTHHWHGIAVQLASEQATPGHPEILTFGVKEELYRELAQGQHVQITYSPHLHHLLSLKHL